MSANDLRRLRKRLASTMRILVQGFPPGRCRPVTDHIQDAAAAVTVIIADGGDASLAIENAAPALRPILRNLADHLRAVSFS